MIVLLSHSEFVRAIVVTLLHFLWQGCFIAAALWIALAMLPRDHAAARHAAACTSLFFMGIAPIITFAIVRAQPPDVPFDPALGLYFDSPTRPPSIAETIMVMLFGIWTIGASVMGVRMVGGMWRLRQLVRHHAMPLDEVWMPRVEQLVRRIGIDRPVRWMKSARIDVPMTVGWLKPVILIPCSVLVGLPQNQLEAILVHELAHVRRYDYLVNIIQSILEVALFYHPCVHWVSRRIRLEREYCCDDTTISLGHDPLVYARALAELEAFRTLETLPALASTGGSLMNRIKRLVKPNAARHDSVRTLLAPVLVMGVMVTMTAIGAAACSAASNESKTAESTNASEIGQTLAIRWLPPTLDRWKPIIAAAASKHNVDANVLAIMMLIESSGDPDATSPAGAVGLMQIMPQTGEAIAKERAIANFSVERLKEPETNVDFGAWLLARQLDTFGKNLTTAEAIELAAAAYNGGAERVRAYLSGTKDLSDETRNYKKLVAGMWSERSADQSTTYRAWRERIRERSAKRATAPVSGARISLPFGESTHPFSGKTEHHPGIDLAKEAGAPVVAPLAGVVRSAAAEGDRGNVVVLDHGGGLETRFHHLGDLNVAPGQTITKGEKIGTVGSTGKSTGPHVHFEVRDNGEPIDPTGYVAPSPAP